jgi:hypothetical protein
MKSLYLPYLACGRRLPIDKLKERMAWIEKIIDPGNANREIGVPGIQPGSVGSI